MTASRRPNSRSISEKNNATTVNATKYRSTDDIEKRSGSGRLITEFFLSALLATPLFSVSLLPCPWQFCSRRRWKTSCAAWVVSLAVFFSLYENRPVRFIFGFWYDVFGILYRWILAGTLRQNFAEFSLAKIKNFLHPVTTFRTMSFVIL